MAEQRSIEPYEHGLLDVGDGNLLYWEARGSPDGKPARSSCTAGPGPAWKGAPAGRSIEIATGSFSSTSADVGAACRMRAIRPPA